MGRVGVVFLAAGKMCQDPESGKSATPSEGKKVACGCTQRFDPFPLQNTQQLGHSTFQGLIAFFFFFGEGEDRASSSLRPFYSN